MLVSIWCLIIAKTILVFSKFLEFGHVEQAIKDFGPLFSKSQNFGPLEQEIKLYLLGFFSGFPVFIQLPSKQHDPC